jgi:PAS domain S-box-containing protein
MDIAGDGQWVVGWSSDGSRHRTFDHIWRAVTGQSVDDARGAGWLDAVETDDRPAVETALDAAFASRQPLRVEYCLGHKDGRCRRVLDAGAPRYGDDGAFLGYAGVIVALEADHEFLGGACLNDRMSRALVEAYAQAVWETDARGVVVADSPSWRAYTGQTLEEWLGDGWVDAIHPEDRAYALGQWRDSAAAGRDVDTEFRLKHKDEGWRWTNVRATPVRAPDGTILKWVGMNIDIHARKVAERARIESERRYRLLFESLRDPFVRTSMDGRLLEFNALYAQMLGYEPEELVKLTYCDLTPERWRDFEANILRDQILPRGYSDVYEKEYRRKNGEVFPIEIRTIVSRDESGVAQSMWAIVRDISERRKVADALRSSEERFRALTTASSDVVYSMNPDWTEMRVLFGRGVLEDIAASTEVWLDKYIPEEERSRVLGAIATAVENEHMFEIEHRVRQADGSPGWIHSCAVPILDENGAIREWFGAAQDITARKRADETLRDADRRKDEFLATLAHELRNPLSPIYNATQVLRKQLGPDDRSAPLLDMVQRQLNHLVRLVDELLELTRIRRGVIELRKESVAVGAVLRDTVEACQPLIDRKEHRVNIHGGDEPLFVFGDPVRLTQILSNLLNNAAKYTPPHGVIDIGATREGDEIVLSVRDNGVGIPADALPRVFDLFAQIETSAAEAAGGLGIGLALARKLVELHGGRIEAHSAGLGRGSEFRVRLPRARAPAAVAVRAEPPASHAGQAPRILVIDNDHDVADSFGLLLESLGAEAHVVYDGPSGIAAVHDHAPDLVFIDIGMPGVDGYETARRIRANWNGSRPVLVAVTGLGQREDRRLSREAGFDLHLTKPAPIDAIKTLLLRAAEVDPRSSA